VPLRNYSLTHTRLYFVKEFDSADSVQVDDNAAEDIPASDGEDATVDEMHYGREATSGAAVAADYMPVRRIVSSKEQLKQQELQRSEDSPSPIVQVKTVPSAVYSIPVHLTAYAYDLGDIASFPAPKKDDSNKLGWTADNY